MAILHREIVASVESPDVRERLAREGADPVTNTPAQFAAHLRAEREKWRQLVRVIKIAPG